MRSKKNNDLEKKKKFNVLTFLSYFTRFFRMQETKKTKKHKKITLKAFKIESNMNTEYADVRY